MKKKIQKTLPNSLTISRFLSIPLLIVGFYMAPYWSFWPVAVIFLLAIITDFLDGYLARYWSTQSKFGMLMDPVADKIVVITTIVLLIYFRIINNFTIIPAIVIICREVFVSALREFMAKEGVALHVMGIAKVKTTTQMVAILALIVGNNKILLLNIAGSITLWAAAFLSVYSAAIYYAKRNS